MSKTRQLAKQELSRCNGNIDWCFQHLKTFLEMGYRDRPEFIGLVQYVILALEATKQVVDDIKKMI